jgi:hypothetical protein
MNSRRKHARLSQQQLLCSGVLSCRQRRVSARRGHYRGNDAVAQLADAGAMPRESVTVKSTPSVVTTGAIEGQFSREIQCDAASIDPYKLWCPVAKASSSGFQYPTGTQTLVGLTVAVKSNAKVRDSLKASLGISALTLGNARIKIQAITPENDKEKKALLATASVVMDVLSGRGIRFPLDPIWPDFSMGYAGKLPAHAYLAKTATGGSAYVVIEEATDGTWVNIYPVVQYKK